MTDEIQGASAPARAGSDGAEIRRGTVVVRLIEGVLDVQGKAIEQALADLGFPEVGAVRVGKVFELELLHAPGAEGAREAESRLREVATRLLANPVMERFTVEIEPMVRPVGQPEE